MTLAVAFKCPEGIALAVDSRITITSTLKSGQEFASHFDNAMKLFGLHGWPNVGVITYGNSAIGMRAVQGFIPEFETKLSEESGSETGSSQQLKVRDIAQKLGNFYSEQWQKAEMKSDAYPVWFLVAGFDRGEAYGRIYEISVPNQLDPTEHYSNTFGVRWGGQSDLANRLLNGVDPRTAGITKEELRLTDPQVQSLQEKWDQELRLSIPWQFLPLQDGVDFATFLVTMTATAQEWTSVGIRGVGGAVDVATITRTEGLQVIKKKQIEVRTWH